MESKPRPSHRVARVPLINTMLAAPDNGHYYKFTHGRNEFTVTAFLTSLIQRGRGCHHSELGGIFEGCKYSKRQTG